MHESPNSGSLKETVELAQLGLGIAHADRREAQRLPRSALRQTTEVQRVQPSQNRITAHALVIGLQDDRLAIGRHLDRATRHPQ